MSVKNKSFLVSDNDVFLDVNLTVSESKRLIAKRNNQYAFSKR